MTVEMLTFCTAATIGGIGELNILGATNQLYSSEVPLLVRQCALVAKVRFDRSEEGLRLLTFSFVDPDGRPVTELPPLQALDVQIPPDASSLTAGTLITIQPLQFAKFGEYRVDLAVNGVLAASVPVFVRKIPPPPHLLPPPSPQPSLG